jgi:hypothetical protein
VKHVDVIVLVDALVHALVHVLVHVLVLVDVIVDVIVDVDVISFSCLTIHSIPRRGLQGSNCNVLTPVVRRKRAVHDHVHVHDHDHVHVPDP